MQLICRSGLPKPTLRVLIAALGDLKKGKFFLGLVKENDREKSKDFKVLPWASQGAMVLWIIYISVI